MTPANDDPNVAGSWVYVVEDDPSVRDSLSLLLQLRGYSTAVFDSAEAFLKEEELVRPGCVLIDVRLPGMSGIELQRRLSEERAALPTIVMTAHGDVATARTALRDGAVDFLEKPIDEQELIEAITLALKSDVEQVERARNRETVLARMQRLTERELEVFERVTNGYHNREIAEEFGISQRTVEVHRARLMEKLHARRVADLFRLRFELEGSPAPAAPPTLGRGAGAT
jgi:RNA polymerase sigma factor (sigma-70 family)